GARRGRAGARRRGAGGPRRYAGAGAVLGAADGARHAGRAPAARTDARRRGGPAPRRGPRALTTMTEPRVAIVHDWLVSMRGGERVLESLCRLYPRAHVYTLRYDRRHLSPEITSHEVTASFVDPIARALPLGRAGFRMLLPLFPAAIESFRLDGYDLVISSSHAVAKGARPAA